MRYTSRPALEPNRFKAGRGYSIRGLPVVIAQQKGHPASRVMTGGWGNRHLLDGEQKRHGIILHLRDILLRFLDAKPDDRR